MAVIPGSTKTHASKKGGRADLAALLEKTATHPNGRVQLDPATGLIVNPRNNVLYKKKLNIKADNVIVGQREIDVNGGHSKQENSVWRRPLSPSRYHSMILADQRLVTFGSRGTRIAPDLTKEENEEYQFFRVFVVEMGDKISIPEDRKADHEPVNKAFYEWLEAQGDRSKIKLLPPSVQSTPSIAPVK